MTTMYKKIIFVLFVILNGILFGQIPNYSNLVTKIKSSKPDIDLANKILILSIWNSNDASSREMNKEFYKTYKTYQNARLSGGLKGVVFISISSDSEEIKYRIASQKDLSDYPLVFCDYLSFQEQGIINDLNLDYNTKNLIYNSSGELIFTNLENSSIFITFNKLTTR